MNNRTTAHTQKILMTNQALFQNRPGVTFSKQSTADVVDQFSAGERQDANNNEAVYAKIRVDTNNALYAFGVDPSTAGYPVNEAGEILLESEDQIKDFRFINATAAEQVTLVVTMFYPAPSAIST